MSIPVTFMEGSDIRDACFTHYILANARFEQLAAGFRSVKGLAWMGDVDCLPFQDLPSNHTMRWIENASVSIDHEPSGYAKGQTRNRRGGLISCIGGLHTLDAVLLNRREVRSP
jgi:gluconolactonase